MKTPRWKVAITQSTTSRNSPDVAYSFSIQNQHGAPLLTISYRTEAELKQAEAAMREAIENAVEISTS